MDILKKRIIISVSNDLYSDQRVNKVCNSLLKMGYDITLLGRELNDSKKINRPYLIKRFNLIFNQGPLFYAALNIRLFFYLLFHNADVLLANDLDTLLPNYIISKVKRIPIVYDSHEYFTEVPELQGRYSKKVWEIIEKSIFPKLKYVFTVNKSIGDIYSKKYGNKINILRNLPNRQNGLNIKSKEELGIADIGKYIILQGAGINIDRGAEELVMAMEHVETTKLLIVGSGDVLPKLKEMVKSLSLSEKVIFIPKQTPENLKSFTYHAELGVSLDKDTNLNYRYSLPNKIFDYIQSGIPVLASDLPEIKNIVMGYSIGLICGSHDIEEIARCITLSIEKDLKTSLKENINKASSVLIWENQEEVLQSVYNQFL